MDFKPKLNVEISYQSAKPAGYDYESRYPKNVPVKYQANMVTRDWGFCLSFLCPDQTISFDLDFMPDQGEDYEEYSVELKLENVEVEVSDSRSIQGDICPKELEVTIKEIKKVGNSFQATGTGVLKF